MATIQEFNNKIDKLINELPKWLEETTKDIAIQDLSVLISERVINTGKDEKGGKFSGYSTKPTLAGKSTFTTSGAFNKIAGSKSKRKSLEWRTVKGNRLFILEGGYKEVRNLEGRETGHKSFERTGEMWQNFGIVRTKGDKTSFKVFLGGRNEDSQEKINHNTEREGINIIGATKEEQKKVEDIYKKRLIKYINSKLS
jgi:hypothetical protein